MKRQESIACWCCRVSMAPNGVAGLKRSEAAESKLLARRTCRRTASKIAE
jgi:hypothetical protein